MSKLIILISSTIFCCNLMFAQDYWIQKSDCPSVCSHGMLFSIGTKAYFGSGWDNSTYHSDLWEYDTDSDSWAQKSAPPWLGRAYSVAFSIDNTGYFGLGLSNGVPLNDWWKYDPTTDSWTQLTSYPGRSKYGAMAFSIANYGYVGIGKDSLGNDTDEFWSYNSLTDSWTQKADFAGVERAYAVGFSIGQKGFVGAGYVSGATFDFPLDFWEYNPLTDSWAQKADFGNPRVEATGFSMNGKGYIGTGGWGNSHKEFFEYDPTLDLWQQKADFGGEGRDGAVSFSANNHGYIGSGHSNALQFADFWEYIPDTTLGISEIDNQSLAISPNPFSVQTTIQTSFNLENTELVIVDLFGNNVRKSSQLSGNTVIVERENLKCGIYFIYLLQNGSILATQKLIVTD